MPSGDSGNVLAQLRDLESRAEAAERAMYDAPRYVAKDHKDDACGFWRRAFDLAKAHGLEDRAAEYWGRRDNLMAVWDRQFRR